MANKYVAFGQLIDGEQTLAKIEKTPTFYESPLSNIVIAKAGILNLEASDIVISRGTTEYIHGHIEDLVELGTVALGVSQTSLLVKAFSFIDLLLSDKSK